MEKIKILITDPIHEAGLGKIKEVFELVLERPSATDEKVKALVTRSGTKVDSVLLDLFPNLRTVVRAGIGFDGIDLTECERRKIIVMNAPFGNVLAAAEHTIALLFSLARKIPEADQRLRKGFWGKTHFLGSQVEGKTLGVIGCGKVGSIVAKKAKALGMRVLVFDPFRKKTAEFKFVDLKTLLSESDFVTLHTPFTAWTSGLIDKEALALMKNDACLINSSRGSVVNEKDLIAALRMKKIKGAALDVFGEEPLPKRSPLITAKNVVITPHLGAATNESQAATSIEVFENLRKLFFEKEGQNTVKFFKPEDSFWPGFERIVFDVDSTLASVEGIDELARLKGRYKEVARLTRDSMEGKVRYEEVFRRRLEAADPGRGDLIKLAQLYLSRVVPEARGLVAALKFLKIEVLFVSGAYTKALFPLVRSFGFGKESLFANELYFGRDGKYLGFDKDNPLTTTDGKLTIMKNLGQARKTIFVGDSFSDLQTKKVVDLFVGFGGIAHRERVARESEVFLKKSLWPLLPLTAGRENCLSLIKSKHRFFLVNSLYYLFQSENKFSREYQDILLKIRNFFLCN